MDQSSELSVSSIKLACTQISKPNSAGEKGEYLECK